MIFSTANTSFTVFLVQACNSRIIMNLSAAIPGGSGDMRRNSVGFADFCPQFLTRDGGIGPLLHFRGKTHRERPAGFETPPPSSKVKELDRGDWVVNTGRNKCMFVEIVIL